MSFLYTALYIIFCFLIIILFIVDVFLVIKFFEYVYCANIKHQPPMVASNKKLRELTAQEINTHYPHAQSVCELGSGFGGMARYIARNTQTNVIGIENMIFSFCVSKLCDLFCCEKSKTIFSDAFEYLKKTNKHFDIAIAYLGPKITPRLLKYKNRFDVLISLDFDIPELKPVRVINMGYGATLMYGKEFPHRLYVYEFKHI